MALAAVVGAAGCSLTGAGHATTPTDLVTRTSLDGRDRRWQWW